MSMPPRTLRKKLLHFDDDEESVEEEEPITSGVDVDDTLTFAVQQALLTKLDNRGGLSQVSNSNRVLQDVCDERPELFGHRNGTSPRSLRRKCQNFIDKLKRLTPPKQAARRDYILTKSAKEKHSKSRPRTSRREHQSSPNVQSPPRTSRREHQSPSLASKTVFSPIITSRMSGPPRASIDAPTDGKSVTPSCCHMCPHVLILLFVPVLSFR